jgi:L-threonylcarbamoyladenylate synthase
LIASENLQTTMQDLIGRGRRIALISQASHHLSGAITNHVMPLTPDGYAHGLYSALRSADLVGADIILVETPPQDGDWQGINDRLRRAAFGSTDILDQMI